MCPAFHHALVAAICALHLEKASEAISWLNVAERSQIQKDELKNALSENSQFEKLRNEPLVSSEWFTHS
jgi:cysteine sulfinate desulfinase/cysteine desulfurase-like protein